MKTTLTKSLLALLACLFVTTTTWAQIEGEGEEEVTYEIPTPSTLVENELNIVGSTDVTVEQYPRTGYDADGFDFDFTEAITKLGVPSAEEFSAILLDLLYAPQYFMGDETLPGGPKLDTLSHEFTANNGFWMRPVLDEDENETTELASAPYGSDDKFYAEAFAFDAETGKFTFNVGQYPNQLRGGQNYYANIYIVYGDKAWRLHFEFTVIKQDTGTLADYNKVGEATNIVEQEPTTNYSTVGVVVDMETIAAELGCAVEDIRMAALNTDGDFAGTTANNGGFWFNADGTVCNWGSEAKIFIEPNTEGNYSLLNVGQYPSALGVGDETSATVYFIGGENYYALTVTLQVIAPQQPDVEFKSVDERGLVALSLVRNDYPCDQYPKIELSEIESILGTTSPKLYGLATDENAEKLGSIYTDAYSCDPNPGFWLNAEGRVSVWGDSNARVGVSYLSDGTFQLFQHPGRNAVGETFTTTLFLVNITSGDMMTVNLSVRFVDEISEKEIVGSEDGLLIPVGKDNFEVVVDLKPAADSLGVSIEDLLSETPHLRGFMKSGIYGEAQDASTGLGFDEDGGYNIYGNIYFTIEYDAVRDEVLLTSSCTSDITEGFNVPIKFCFEVDDKQYVVNARLVSEDVYVGIDKVGAENADHLIYDLAGRRIEKPVRGLYIQQGRKVVIK